MVKKVIIDTDVGLDDAEAILFLLSCPDIEVVAITLVAGNSNMPTISENLKRLLDFVGSSHIPVYESGSYSLLGQYIISDGYFGKNAFGNAELPVTNMKSKKDMTSSQALIHYNKLFPGEITSIFIGPLTTLALSFLADNDFHTYCGPIIVMGGDQSETTIENCSSYAEFNFKMDPLAVHIVSKCLAQKLKTPITLIEWTLCRTHYLSMKIFDYMFGADKSKIKANKRVELLSILRDFTNPIMARSVLKEGFRTADLFAAVVAEKPELITKSRRVTLEKVDLDVKTPGHSCFKDDENGSFLLVEKMDMPAMEKLVVSRFTGHPK